MKKKVSAYILFMCFAFSSAQNDSIIKNQKDLADVFHSVFSRKMARDSVKKKFQVSVLPTAGYTLQTGWTGVLSANIGFKQSELPEQKISTINTSINYSEYRQIILPIYASFWSKGNTWNLISDIKFMKYPSSIYGLGLPTISEEANSNTPYSIDYFFIKFHETIMFSLKKNLFLGGGYFYDQFWNIKTLGITNASLNEAIQQKLGTKEVASGINLRMFYDSRLNQINPSQGFYANMVYRPNFKILGSSINWATLQVDVRKYFTFPKNSENTLAFWGFAWMNTGENPASYLLLPSNGWDDQYNTGRGYIQGRFRGKNMFYYENEYRFKILKNGLLGGVVFGNAQTFSGDLSQDFKKIIIGYGFGLRLKLNKFSKTNLCVDYGFGKDNSRGFFVNLGEVF